jgi:hypothetical protein
MQKKTPRKPAGKTAAPKNKGGRPPHQPTEAHRKEVKALASYGVPHEEIGRVIGISDRTLREHYRDELDLGTIKANAMVAQSLFKKATGDGPAAVTAAIFWLKTRARWKEPALDHNHRGAVGAFDLTKVSDADLDRLERILGPAAVAGADQGGEGTTGG